MKNIIYLLLGFLIFSCKTQQSSQHSLSLSKDIKIVFQDSIAAGQTITQDNLEYFFDWISIIDMEVQIHKDYPEEISRKEVLKDYKDFLKKDVTDFTKEDIVFIEAILKDMFQLCNQVSTNIFPSELKLVKTHGRHYGNSVYYTRENSIIIPKDVLASKNHEAFLSTMLHELSHIYTRYHPKKRKALYQLIGFKQMGSLGDLTMDKPLKDILLLNPDGINFAQSIQLKQGDKTIDAVPIITSKKKNYDPTMPNFFLYLDFNIYQVEAGKVLSDKNGKSTIQLSQFPDFFSQIKDNTQYIIHPDEIIADNFMHCFMSLKTKDYAQKFSKEGSQLLEDIKSVISQ